MATKTEIARENFRKKYEHDLFGFTVDVLGYKAPYAPLHRDVVCPFLTEWDDDHYMKFLALPREHLKSTLCSVAMPLWIWGLNPKEHNFPCGTETRFLQGHGKLKDAKTFIKEAKHHLVQNELYRWAYPHVVFDDMEKESDMWTTEQYNIRRKEPARTPSMRCTGVGTPPTGFHFHWQILDDLVIRENVNTAEGRRAVLQYIQDIQAVLLNGGKILIPGTRWHHDDAYGYILDPHGPFRNILQSLILKSGFADGKPIFPISKEVPHCGFDMKRLQQKLSSMGKYDFMCQYENDPQPDAENSFNEKDIQRYEFDFNGELPTHKNYHFYTAVDPNRSMDEANDPAAVVTAAVDEDNEIWVVEISSHQYSVRQLVDEIHRHQQKWSPQAVIIETTTVGLPIKYEVEREMITRKTRFPIIEAKRGGRGKGTKIDRIRAMIPLCERNGIHVRRGGLFDKLVEELVQLTVAKHDDMADALADIYQFSEPPKPKERHRQQKPPESLFALKNLLGDISDISGSGNVTRRRY